MSMFLLVVARLSFVIFFMPGIGEQVVPVQLRLMILLAIAMSMASTGVVAVPSLESLTGYGGLLLSELTIGFCLGAILRVSVWMLSIAGTIISQSIGLSQLLGVALEREAQSLTGSMLSMAGTAILLTADFHLNAIASLMRLYTDIPVGALSALDWDMLIERSFSAVGFAVLLAWPFVAVNLLYNICLGFINKALPQLMVAFVGAPLMIGGGTILLALSVVGLLVVWKDRVIQIVGWM
ncbi:MAG: flagellar biosynthetic protein FliR [Alphaproteobacteria bacterium]|nr:flagellar biosynthetic protein FliR [Alphaproteobacteria bacterium]